MTATSSRSRRALEYASQCAQEGVFQSDARLSDSLPDSIRSGTGSTGILSGGNSADAKGNRPRSRRHYVRTGRPAGSGVSPGLYLSARLEDFALVEIC